MNITDEQSGKTKVTDPVVRGNFLPDNPTQFDYLHAIRAIASRIGNKQIFDLADAGMNLVDAGATCSHRWFPIESAPKDGTNILIFNGSVLSVYWFEYSCQAGGMWYLTETGSYATDGYLSVEPTHWMPLPSLPNEQSPSVDATEK